MAAYQLDINGIITLVGDIELVDTSICPLTKSMVNNYECSSLEIYAYIDGFEYDLTRQVSEENPSGFWDFQQKLLEHFLSMEHEIDQAN